MTRKSHIELDPKLEIVIASSSPEFSGATQRILKNGGFGQVTKIDSPTALIDHCSKSKVEMLICDHLQNDIPAWQLIKTLKTADNIPNIPIVFTGKGHCPITPNELSEYGVEFVSQPFDLRSLMNAFVLTYSAHSRQDTLEGKFSAAKQALLNNQTIEAIDSYQGLYEQTNHSTRSTVGLAQALEKNHDFHQAQQLIVASGPNEDLGVLQMKLKIALNMENINQATELVQMILSATQYAEFYFRSCIEACVNAKSWVMVQKLVKAALKRSVQHPDFYIFGARAAYNLNAIAEAFEMLEMAEKKAGPSLKIYEIRGRCHLKLEEFQAAVNVYTLAIKLDPSNPQTFFNRALAQLELGKFAEAEADLLQALKVAPSFVLASQKLKELRNIPRKAG